MVLERFPQIHPRAFTHPSDREATTLFEQLPVLPEVLKKVSQHGFEKRFRAYHMLNSVEIGPRQLPSIAQMVHEVAERLGVPPPPTYLTRAGGINAFAFGKQRHSIVLTTGLVDLMNNVELKGIIAHEMGHILCQHMLYMDVGLALSMRSGAVPSLAKMLPLFEDAVAGLFFKWFRAAEYSADRAALLILGDPEPLALALSRLAGVPRRFADDQFDYRLFAEQVASYESEATVVDRIAAFGLGFFDTHPEPARRVAALLEWAESEEYRRILRGCYMTKFEAEALDRIQIEGVRSCALCRSPIGPAPVCETCGLDQDPQRQQRCPCDHLANVAWKFCKACGADLRSGAARSGTPAC